jgi:P27 family predicted phage terminase small subunit
MSHKKPTAMKILEGTYRVDQVNLNEPMPKVGIPNVPDWLDEVGREEYLRAGKILAKIRVLTEADGIALAIYAQAFSNWLAAESKVLEDGPILTSERGGKYLNPWKSVASMELKTVTAFLLQFGMTPASRTKIEAQPESNEEPLANRLFGAA